jgi:hypothetical protein
VSHLEAENRALRLVVLALLHRHEQRRAEFVDGEYVGMNPDALIIYPTEYGVVAYDQDEPALALSDEDVAWLKGITQ